MTIIYLYGKIFYKLIFKGCEEEKELLVRTLRELLAGAKQCNRVCSSSPLSCLAEIKVSQNGVPAVNVAGYESIL